MDKSEVYSSWYNKGCGLELYPDMNHDSSKYTSENGALFYAEYITICNIINDISSADRIFCERLVKSLQVSDRPGRYHRDLDSSVKYDLNKNVNPISKDNLLGMIILLRFLGFEHKIKEMRSALLSSLGTFNNTRSIRTPFNPGFYAGFGALLGGVTGNILSLLCFPIFIINFIITNLKNKSHTSSRLLYFITLYNLKNIWIYSKLYNIYIKLLKYTYKSNNPLHSMCVIYFKNSNHPIIQISKLCEDKY